MQHSVTTGMLKGKPSMGRKERKDDRENGTVAPYVCRRRGLEFLSLTGKVEGKRDRGKQRITFLDSLCNSATGGQSKGLNFLKLSDDREVWRGMVANVCSRSGT